MKQILDTLALLCFAKLSFSAVKRIFPFFQNGHFAPYTLLFLFIDRKRTNVRKA